MSTVISSSFVLSPEAAVLRPNAGLLAFDSIVSETRVSATSQDPDNPVTNLANVSTTFVWQAADTADQNIDIEIGTSINYVAFARHNINSPAEIRIQAQVGTTFSNLTDWFTPRRQVFYLRLNDATPDGIRLQIRNAVNPAIIGVLYAGLALELQRNIYVGHTPITYARNVDTIGGYSENGQYLGEVIRREGRSNTVSLQNLTAEWYRENLDPFIAQRPRKPAFFAWRPGSYPEEVGYVWLTGSPQPVNQRSNGMMSIDMQFEAIV